MSEFRFLTAILILGLSPLYTTLSSICSMLSSILELSVADLKRTQSF